MLAKEPLLWATEPMTGSLAARRGVNVYNTQAQSLTSVSGIMGVGELISKEQYVTLKVLGQLVVCIGNTYHSPSMWPKEAEEHQRIEKVSGKYLGLAEERPNARQVTSSFQI